MARYVTSKRRKSKKPFFIIVLIVLLIGVGFLVFNLVKGDSVENKTEVAEAIRQETQAAKKSEWNLILVNKDNSLPDNYSPTLATHSSGYLVDERIVTDLDKMLNDGKKDGLSLLICSAYRSVEKKKELFNNQVSSYEDEGLSKEEAIEEAKTEVAYPGTSEHNLGLALDIVTPDYQVLDDGFAETDEAKWLKDNSYKYGFILRYPKGKQDITGVIFEPWHFFLDM